MQNLSQNQLLTLWSELMMAYNGTNGFGGDTAEIYAYTLRPDCPMRGNGTSQTAEHEGNIQAARSLSAVCLEIEKRYVCRVRIDGLPIKKWLKKIDAGFGHRAPVKITGDKAWNRN